MSKKEKIIYEGRTSTVNYIQSVLALFHDPDTEEVTLKGRGNVISLAVDVAEITRRRFLGQVEVGEIQIGSEKMPVGDENRVRMVSTIEMKLKRSKLKRQARKEEK